MLLPSGYYWLSPLILLPNSSYTFTKRSKAPETTTLTSLKTKEKPVPLKGRSVD